MKIPHFDEHNEHPKKLYRAHVVGFSAPTPAAIEYFQEQHPGKEWFAPSSNRIYRSRSAAVDRVSLLTANGIHAVLVSADIDWSLSETKDEKIARLEAEVAELKRF